MFETTDLATLAGAMSKPDLLRHKRQLKLLLETLKASQVAGVSYQDEDEELVTAQTGLRIINSELSRRATMNRRKIRPKRSSLSTQRMPSTVNSRNAAKRMVDFIEDKGLGLTEFATKAGTTERTIRKFRKTGTVRRNIFDSIAKAMGTTREGLLKPEE
jgi:hypothetical protein